MKRSNEKEEEETKGKRRLGETHEYRHLTRASAARKRASPRPYCSPVVHYYTFN